MDVSNEKIMIGREISCKAASMSLLCACVVVFIHTGFLTTPENRFFHEFFHGTGIFAFAVPYFFLASGYFIATKTSDWWLQCLRKRVISLLMPYLLWNFVAWALMEALIAGANYSASNCLDSSHGSSGSVRLA